MIATTEEQRLLEKWQKKLCLQEWRIKLVTHLRPEEMSVSNATGCTDWSESIKTARIEIINPACYGDRIVPFNFEKTLVHVKGCLLEKPCVCFLWNLLIERLMKVGGSLILSSSSSNELGDKGDKGECFCKDFFQIGVF